MLIYNFQKEFLGIDEIDLKKLGFEDLQGLRAEVHDFSDLFVKTPGYVHNFKHVHWIDFITCAESNEESKVIINVNNKNYTATIQINTAFLVDNPSSTAYLVSLNHLRELTAKESERISGDITQRETPVISQESKQIFNASPREEPTPKKAFTQQESRSSVTNDPYETPLDINMDDEPLNIVGFDDEPTPVKETPPSIEPQKTKEIPQELDNDIPLDIDIEDDIEELVVEEKKVVEKPRKHIEVVKETFDNGYIYDPSVASDELGLPLDLIEEFIQDFIEQAKEFKKELYLYLNNNELENLKVLSHKLKGVAANLRIEDALETITIVNTNSDINLISENLDTFYKIISKLAGETIDVEKVIEENEIMEAVEEELEEDGLYSDPIEINDEEISMPEAQEEELKIDIDLDVSEPAPQAQEEELKIDIDLDISEPAPQPQEEEMKIDIDLDVSEPAPQPQEEELKIDIDLDISEPAPQPQEEEMKIDIDLDVSEPAPQPQEEEMKIDIDLDVSEPAPQPQEEVNYSMETAADAIGLDLESFQELFEDYVEEAQELLETMKKASESNNIDTIHTEAMKFKGMSENMRIEVFDKEMERLLNSNDTQEINLSINSIHKILDALVNKKV